MKASGGTLNVCVCACVRVHVHVCVMLIHKALCHVYPSPSPVCRFYKGLSPLWMRQIPYTMMKFAAFERTVEALYKYVVPVPRDSMSKPQQLVVTFAAGYIAGVFCALVSHPADSVVSKLNSEKGSTAVEVAKKLGWKGEGCCIMGVHDCIMVASGCITISSALYVGMWKGLGPRILMIGTLTALQWFIYDTTKVVLRLPRPPPPVMPESLKRRLEAKQATSS